MKSNNKTKLFRQAHVRHSCFVEHYQQYSLNGELIDFPGVSMTTLQGKYRSRIGGANK